MQRIELLWKSRDAVAYLNSLLLEDSLDRQGFSISVLNEISLLKQVHEFLFPELSINKDDPFDQQAMVGPAGAFFELSPVTSKADRAASPVDGSVDSTTAAPIAPSLQAIISTTPIDSSTDEKKISWPDILTQRDLYDISERLRNGERIYAEQGKQIGEILKSLGAIDDKALEVIGEYAHSRKGKRKPTGQLLVSMGMVEEEVLERALCIQSGIPMVDVLSIIIPPEVLKLVPGETARDKEAIPVGMHHGTLYVAVADPVHFPELQYLSFLTKLLIKPVFAPRHAILNRLSISDQGKTRAETRDEFRELANKAGNEIAYTPSQENIQTRNDITEGDSIIINLVNKIITNAIDDGASDIHIELFQNSPKSMIRFRRDGRMERFSDFPKEYHNAVVSRIKVMSSLDIADKRRPQDGKISLRLPDGKSKDLRVSTIPTLRNTEFVTIRILSSGEPLPLEMLGMGEHNMGVFRKSFKHPHGLILVCGPTGSGKTTTLHSVLKELNTEDRKIWTAEDPVEIVQNNLCQVQINPKAGLNFGNILRAFLRADPDVIMIGEMRDAETAQIALEASMTGHLVLSTLHTNSAAETVSRLVDMDVTVFNLADALLAILAQRLTRKLCPICSRKEEASHSDIENMADEYHHSSHGKLPGTHERNEIIRKWRDNHAESGKLFLRHPVGCKLCNAGYKGMIGLYELLEITGTIKQLVRTHAAASEYLSAGIAEGMITMKQDGIEKVLRGITDMEQVHGACA